MYKAFLAIRPPAFRYDTPRDMAGTALSWAGGPPVPFLNRLSTTQSTLIHPQGGTGPRRIRFLNDLPVRIARQSSSETENRVGRANALLFTWPSSRQAVLLQRTRPPTVGFAGCCARDSSGLRKSARRALSGAARQGNPGTPSGRIAAFPAGIGSCHLTLHGEGSRRWQALDRAGKSAAK
jgi:hypothetical protein